PPAVRPLHDRPPGIKQLFCVEIEIRVPASEEPREEALKPLVGLIERLLEAGASLAVDLSNRPFEGLERLGQIGELSIEVLLALGLLFELVYGRKVDRAEPLDLPFDRLEILRPRGGRCLLRKLREHLLELEAGLPELLGDGFEPHLRFAGGEADVVRGLTRGCDGLLGLVSLLLD